MRKLKNFTLAEETIAEFEKIAELNHWTQSEMVNQALDEKLNKFKETGKWF